MDASKQSRRKFIGRSFVLMGAGVAFSSLIPLSATAVPALENRMAGLNASDLPDLDKIKALLRQKDPIKWLFTGDSITAGVLHTEGYRSYPEVFAERIRWEMARPRDIVINTAISGNITQNILDDFSWRVGQFKPEVVSLMIGTNDCSRKEMTPGLFESKLNVLLSEIRKTGAIPILHTPNSIIMKYAPERTSLPEYVRIIKKTAEKESVIFVDNYGHWENETRSRPDANLLKEWLNDPIHPGPLGHQEIARLMFKTLSIFDAASPTGGGKYYHGVFDRGY
jgi:acyl-CoA thioesterase-1